MQYPTELLRRHTAPAPANSPIALYYAKTRFLPMEAFGQVARGIGHISRTADTDGGVRRDRKSTRLNSSHIQKSRMPSSA